MNIKLEEKYNVGDKVASVDCIQFLTNRFHWKSKLKYMVREVTWNTDKKFSTELDAGDIWERGCIAGYNRYMFCSQETGLQNSYPSPDRFLKTNDPELKMLVDEHFDEYVSDKKDDLNDKIYSLKIKISMYEQELENLNSGEHDICSKKRKVYEVLELA